MANNLLFGETKIPQKNGFPRICLVLVFGIFLVPNGLSQVSSKIIFRNLNEFVRGISIRKDSCLIFVTESGMIGKMPVSGQNFDSLYASPYGLADVDFFTDSLGFACGEFGKVLKTTDRGTTWQAINFSVSQAFTDIELLGNGFGILAGQNGSLFLTHDFGNSWINRSKTVLGPVNRTYFIDSSRIIIHSGNGKLFHYNPQTDSLLTLTVPIFVDEFSIDRQGRGSACSNLLNKEIYQTTDFGATWTSTNGTTYTNTRFSDAISYRGKQWFVGGYSMQQSVNYGQTYQLFEDGDVPLRQFGYSASDESIANYDTLGGNVYLCGKNGIIANISIPDLSFSAVSGGFENIVINAFQETGKLIVITAKSVFSKSISDMAWKRNKYFSELGLGRMGTCVGRISEGNYAFSGTTKIYSYSSEGNQLAAMALPYNYEMTDFKATGSQLYSYGYYWINSSFPDKCILRFSSFPSSPYDIDCFPQHTDFAFGKDGSGFKFSGSLPSIDKVKNWGNNIYPLISQASSISGISAIAIDSSHCIFYDYNNNALKRTKDQFATQYPVLQFLSEDNFARMQMFDSTLIVLTTQGRIYRSLDTGINWQLFETNFLFSNPGPFILTSANTLVVLTSVGLAEIDMGTWISESAHLTLGKALVHAYPNPFSDWLKIEVSEPVKQIELLDVNGKVVSHSLERNADGSIRVSHLHGGFYFLKVVTQNKVFTQKLFRL